MFARIRIQKLARAYFVDSRKACYKVCNNTITAKHCEPDGMLEVKYTPFRLKNSFCTPKCKYHKVLSYKGQTKKVVELKISSVGLSLSIVL